MKLAQLIFLKVSFFSTNAWRIIWLMLYFFVQISTIAMEVTELCTAAQPSALSALADQRTKPGIWTLTGSSRDPGATSPSHGQCLQALPLADVSPETLTEGNSSIWDSWGQAFLRTLQDEQVKKQREEVEFEWNSRTLDVHGIFVVKRKGKKPIQNEMGKQKKKRLKEAIEEKMK